MGITNATLIFFSVPFHSNYYQLLLCATGKVLADQDGQRAFNCVAHRKEQCDTEATCKWFPYDQVAGEGVCLLKQLAEHTEGPKLMNTILKEANERGYKISTFMDKCLKNSFGADGDCGQGCAWCNAVPNVYKLKQGGNPLTKLCVAEDNKCRALHFPMADCSEAQSELPAKAADITNPFLRVGCETHMCLFGVR